MIEIKELAKQEIDSCDNFLLLTVGEEPVVNSLVKARKSDIAFMLFAYLKKHPDIYSAVAKTLEDEQ
jgi:hypothetical protein